MTIKHYRPGLNTDLVLKEGAMKMNCVPRYREHLDAAVTIDVMNGHFMEAWHPNWPEK